MTLTRYQIRNEYGLGDKELYRAATKDDSEALLEGASMAGLVGVLRQLGDLAEFAAEIFHGLHEQVMTTAARGHGLAMRLQQLEAEFPAVEIPILSQTDHSKFFCDPGLEWHSNMQLEENLISPRNLPHCIMDSYEECRGPPQLFLLDKFDVAGSGSCLKRYSDPSFLKTSTESAVAATSILGNNERPSKTKKIASRRIGKETPEASRRSHAKLHHLFLLEHVENGHSDPAISVKLKRRQLTGPPINLSTGRGYMENFLKNSSPYCERVHGTVDHSSPAMETEVTVCSVQEDLPISSMVYPVNGDTRKYNEKESIADDERLELPQEIIVDEKYLEEGAAICLEKSSSMNSRGKVNNDTDAPASTKSEAKEVDSNEKADSDLGFPGFGQTHICNNADETQTEDLAQFSDVLHHSPEEGESSLVCTDLQRSEGSAVEGGISLSKLTPDKDSSGMRTLEFDQEPFSLASYESPPHLSGDSGSLQLQSNKENADDIGLESSEACELFEVRDPVPDVSTENHPESLLKLTQVPLDASEGGTEVLLTNHVEDQQSQHIFCVETESEISLSALVEDQVSSITIQETLDPEDISSETNHSIPDSKSSLFETPAALKSDCPVPDQNTSTFDNFEDLSLATEAQDDVGTHSVVPKEGETNSQDGSSMDSEQCQHLSIFEISSENGTLMSDTARDVHTGSGNLSASTWQEDALANSDLAEISSYSGQEGLQTMSIVADDSSDTEVPIPDTQRHGTCFAGDDNPNNQTGLNDKASATVPGIDLENITDPQGSVLGTQECLSPEYCIQTQDQGKESLSETGSANLITSSAESFPCQVSTRGVHVDVQSSPSEEDLTCNEKLHLSSLTEIEAIHAPHQEIFTLSNDGISKPALSMDLTDQENCLDMSPNFMIPFSTSLHEAPKTDPEITPPLPPLPPTNWLMGKLVESVKTTETHFSPLPSLAGSRTNSFNIHRDETIQNGSVQAMESHYPSNASITANENHNVHVYSEESSVEAVSTAAQTTQDEPSKATEKQSLSAVSGTSDTYMHNDESTPKCLDKTAEETFASISLRTAEAATESESAEGFEADWRAEAMALEWFSQNLREHADPNSAKVDEEPQLDQPPRETKFPQTLRDNNSYDRTEKVGKLPRDSDSLGIGIDRSMLRKVSEQDRTRAGARVDENGSLLEIIRSKSFNLRPADASVRPNFQVAVPKTNLKVAAILEKANTLRQAMAGSDDDQDSDSWSE